MPFPGPTDSLNLRQLSSAYRTGSCTPIDVAKEVLRRIAAHDDKAVWIELLSKDEILTQARAAMARQERGASQPLFGIPFAVKDNIDVAGRPTTAACPGFAYRAAKSAAAVQKLCDAGAILVGKTNLDQFATGLVGTRSPFGTPRNPFDAGFIPGGSSSGSAVAVSAGLVSFSLGTDTAGSGRVPASFNNIVGLKPTRGRISTTGVVPACRSLDCVSIFALTCDDAAEVLRIAEGEDPTDDFSRPRAQTLRGPGSFGASFRFGIPADDQLRFFSNASAPAVYRQAIERLQALGGSAVTIDLSPFTRAGVLLYEGPWVAERLAALRDFFADYPEAVLPVTRNIIQSARRFDAVGAFSGFYELQSLKRQAGREWEKIDLLLLPTAGTIYTLEQIAADPVQLNANLGYYTTFANLMDLSGVAVPSGFLENGLPFGVSLIGPAGFESALLELGQRMHAASELTLGATDRPFPPPSTVRSSLDGEWIRLAVVGAHLSGQPLNPQLTDLKARLVRSCRTAPQYRLFALPGTKPPKPGLIRTSDGNGAMIELEVWEMPAESFGRFVAAIPPPLGIGTLSLEDGESVKGFLCESHALSGATDITAFGGWRAFLQAK